MSFTSLEFALFLALCVCVLQVSGKLSFRTGLLILFSYVFCFSFGIGGAVTLTLVAFADFFLGARIADTENDDVRMR